MSKSVERGEEERIQDGFTSWVTLLVLVVFVVVIWGGLVRLTGSGLSIPDWPMINGSLLPPLSEQDWQSVYSSYHKELFNVSSLTQPTETPLGRFKAMFAIEYIHRFLAALTGILFFTVFIKSLRKRFIWQKIRWNLTVAALLLLGQAILGGVVVKQELQAELVAVHLGIAFVLFGLLLWITLKLSKPKDAAEASKRKNISRLAWLATGAVLLQVIIGGLTAGTKAGLIFNTFPKMGDYLIPPIPILFSDIYGNVFINLIQNQILIQFLHRWWAFVALGFVILLVVKGIQAQLSPRGRLALRMVGTVTVFQILWGILNLLLKVPAIVSLVHLATALLILAMLLIIAHDAKYEYVSATA